MNKSYRAYYLAPLETVEIQGVFVIRPEFHEWLFAQQGRTGYAMAVTGSDCVVLVAAGMGILRELELRFGNQMLTEEAAKLLLRTCNFGGPTPDRIALGITWNPGDEQVLLNPVGG